MDEVAKTPRRVLVDLGDVVVHQLDHALLVLGDAAVEADDVRVMRRDDVGVAGEVGDERADLLRRLALAVGNPRAGRDVLGQRPVLRGRQRDDQDAVGFRLAEHARRLERVLLALARAGEPC